MIIILVIFIDPGNCLVKRQLLKEILSDRVLSLDQRIVLIVFCNYKIPGRREPKPK